jgi:hypothetical protein
MMLLLGNQLWHYHFHHYILILHIQIVCRLYQLRQQPFVIRHPLV